LWGFQLRRWIPGCVLVRALYRSCVSLCQDPSTGTGSLVACLRVYSVAPAGAYVGIPVTVLVPWVRACACTLSHLRELVSGSHKQYWILGCVLACTLCRPCGSLLLDPSVGTGFLGKAPSWFTSRRDLKKKGGEGHQAGARPSGTAIKRAHSWFTSQRDSRRKGTRLVYVPEGQQKGKGTRLVHIPEGQQKGRAPGWFTSHAGAYVGILLTALDLWVRACPWKGCVPGFRLRHWIPECLLSHTVCRSCGSLCRDLSHGVGSLGDCLSVHSVTPSGVNVGIPAMALDPWARACACTLSFLR
jgi:hypothetical protein